MAQNYFSLSSAENFIDFEMHGSIDDILRQTFNGIIYTPIELEKVKETKVFLHENRIELQDSRLNFLDFFPAQTVNYLNVEE